MGVEQGLLALIGAADVGGYEIEQSLRFDGSSHLSWTPRSAGNRRTSTFSVWFKPTTVGGEIVLFSATGYTKIAIDSGGLDHIWFQDYDGSVRFRLETSASLRDPSAWYHLVGVVDTTNATASDRVRLYLNGERISAFGTNTQPSQNFETDWSNTVEHKIGSDPNPFYFRGYMAECHFIDGTAVTDALDFGEYDNNGVWRPIKPTLAEASRYSNSGYQALFDGSTSTDGPLITNTYVTVASGLNLEAASSVGFTTNGGIAAKYIRINGTDEYTVTGGGNGPHDFSHTGTINTIEIKYNGSVYFTTIRVDGAALVDSSYGDYGANGFYLKFDPSATNGIGHDHSGNGNNFTPSGFVTTGTGTDVFSDTPTTNYATLNPLHRFKASSGNTSPALSEGNLVVTGNYPQGIGRSTIAMSSGKFYFETTITSIAPDALVGIYKVPFGETTNFWQQATQATYYSGTGAVFYPSTSSVQTYSTYTTGDIIGVALDLDNGKVFFSKNGTWQGSSDPAAGTNPAVSGLTGEWTFGATCGGPSGSTTVNFGQRAFAYTPPTGFKALNTSNLPAPTVKDGSDYFNTVTYTGNGTTQTITNVGFQPDFVWVKNRDQTVNHVLFDAVRGFGSGKELASDVNNAEGGLSSNLYGYVSGVNSTSDGSFSVAAGTSGANYVNVNSIDYAAWNWLAGNGTSSISTGSVDGTNPTIASTVSVNASAGFSIVTYAGSGTGGDTIGHGLGVPPKMIIAKSRGGGPYPTASWAVYHESIGASKSLALDTTATAAGPYSNPGTIWYNTTPTSTVFYVGNLNETNGSNNYVAYCFAEVEGYSKFGSYTANYNSDGPFVYTGFAPQFLIIKQSDGSNNWVMLDTKRVTYNPRNRFMSPDNANGENTPPASETDFLSNGFKIRTNWSGLNYPSGGTFVYMAFASNPFGGVGVSPATAR